MKKINFRLPDGLAVALGLGLLLAAGLFAAFWPQGDFSDFERRYLASAPSAPSLTDWKTDKQVESYLSDRIPFRRVMVGIDATANVLTGRRTQLETWPVNGTFLEQPVAGDVDSLARRLTQLDEAARKAGAPWRVIVPTGHGYLLHEEMNALLRPLYAAEAPLYAALEEYASHVKLGADFNAQTAYYATDHHWSLQGVYAAYRAYCASVDIEPLALEDFELTSFEGFYGTTYSRSGYPFAGADTLECAEPAEGVHLTILDDGTEYDSLIFPEHAATYDGYAVYLGGNHGLLEITNQNAPQGTLLVFKDSFANSLLPLLSAHYSRIVAMDARYYAGNFSDAIAAAGDVEQVLYVYSLDSLLNDTMVARKIGR
ncbi:MAG: hypothetical protein E7316_10415 [Clostridiales bacterium]|nr:hypothetical protein [Clostridiales bacterium]